MILTKDKVSFPWQDKPAGSQDVLWRYSENPIIGRYDIPSSNSIYNQIQSSLYFPLAF